MVDMARSDEEKAEAIVGNMPSVADQPDYPYGLSISLSHDDLAKLDLEDDCEVGDMIDLRAFAKVTSCSKREVGGKAETRIELQITHLSVENEDTED